MSIQAFIQNEILSDRLSKKGVLVVYDPDQRYRELCLGMASDHCQVVDASDSSILSRETAIQTLQHMGKENSQQQLVVYVPHAMPITDEDKQRDPFSIYLTCGASFPNGDGDQFESLCLKYKPDQAQAIHQIFLDNPSPAFAVIDAIGGGLGWPILRALLAVESSRDILFSLLAPSETQQKELKASDNWVVEARDLLKNSLGLSLKTKGKTWSSIAEELWRFLLFSEFVFDLPEALPSALEGIPHAPAGFKALVEDLCDRLRNDRRTQALYIDRAEIVERELELPNHCSHFQNLGLRDTFPFEERTFLSRAISALLNDDCDAVRTILEHHQQSVWTGKGESRGQWDLIRSAMALIQACDDYERQLAQHTRQLNQLVDFYAASLREVDRLHREFEQSLSDYEWQDPNGMMMPVKSQARKHYSKLMDKVQSAFTRLLEQEEWPLNGKLFNGDVFDKLVAPKLQAHGRRVAYFMIDALRYELGAALEQQLTEDGAVQLTPAMAQLPTITLVGMASLLPGAGQQLYLLREGPSFVPMLGEFAVKTVDQRMDVFRRRYGQRFQEARLEEFVRNRVEVTPDTDLLVLRAVEIDSQFENQPDTAPNEISNALRRIRMAIHRLISLGFHEVVIATDHGFFLNTHVGAGDVCAKPQGDWVLTHERCALGEGAVDSQHFALPLSKAGIRGDFSKFAAPRTLAAYRNGMSYFHGGVSLQECIVPVLTLQLKQNAQPSVTKATIQLTYKNGAKSVTTRVPVLEVMADNQDLFSVESDFDVLIEAYNAKGDVVGEAKRGGAVNPATGTVSLKPGQKVQVTLKMQMEFEGKFKVKALNPKTGAMYCQLELETNYAV